MTSITASTGRTAVRQPFFLFPVLALLLLPAAAPAQPLKITIEGVRVGFPAGVAGETRLKSGAWAPVYVEVKSNKDFPPGRAVLIVETADSDNVQNRYLTPVPALDEDRLVSLLSYVRPGNLGADIKVTIRDEDREYDSIKPGRMSQYPLGPDTVLYLVAGRSRPPRLRQVILQDRREEEQGEDEIQDLGFRRIAYIDRIEQMPTRWFGYQAVDILVLTTGNESFIKELVEEQSHCKEALAEWVRRGGKLVLSVGHNHQWVSRLLSQIEQLSKVKLIDCEIQGTVLRRHLVLHPWVGQRQVRPFAREPLEVAMLAPGKNVDVLVKERDFPVEGEAGGKVDNVERPLLVQAPCGLGRVLLVAFDLEQGAFTQWPGQTDFYLRLKQELEPRPSRAAADRPAIPGQPIPNPMAFDASPSPEIASLLQDSLESFDDIPVVSFGWVALFIFLYILVVGPLDYLFLKKVVKRLELTWITFPVVVVVVSTLAYFTAYYLKGNDLKINKVDLVDVDLHSGRSYGSTWFTLFSPRIQNYTVGVEPAYPGWAREPDPAGPGDDYSTLVGWMGRPENVWGGSGRSGGGGLFRRAYTYAPNAAGLEGVPIQVWATKSFTASWEAPFPADRPLFTAKLRHTPASPENVDGPLTSNLPVDLEDVVAFYRGQVYPIGRLTPGVPYTLNTGDAQRQGARSLDQWFQEYLPDARLQQTPRSGRFGWAMTGDLSYPALMKAILFFRKNENYASSDNATLRHLDQSWRLSRERENEVILFGRTAPRPAEAAEAVTKDGLTASRLWLGAVPRPNTSRPELAGTILQRTFVRVFIPVAPKE